MDPVPAWTWRLWKAWDIQLMILLSLALQIILIILGNRRKYMRGNWIEIVVWCAYLMADWVAAFCIGTIVGNLSDEANSNTGRDDPNNGVMALWAPLLLVHLGGPDTITAYSIEDTQLWLRHLLGLVVQVSLTVFVILFCWTAGSWLSILSLPMLMAGIIKYGERSWVLWYANHKDQPRPLKQIEDRLPTALRDIPGVKLLVAGYVWSQALSPYLENYVGDSVEIVLAARIASEYRNGEKMFELIEFVLGFLYDVLYTKAAIIYTKVGCFVRIISLICMVTGLVGFSTISKDDYSNVDVFITYTLLLGAVALEVYAITLAIYSDWGILEMIKHCTTNSSPVTQLVRVLAPQTKYWQRGSIYLPQFNLMSFFLYEEKPKVVGEILKIFRIDEQFKKYKYRYRYQSNIVHDDRLKDLKLLILKRVESMGAVTFTGPGDNFKLTISNYLPAGVEGRKIYDFDEFIFALHIATDIFYNVEDCDDDSKSLRETTKVVSDYMMHLYVYHPHMLHIKAGNVLLKSTCERFKELLVKEKGNISKENISELYKVMLVKQFGGHESLGPTLELVKDILELEGYRNWHELSDTWVMLLLQGASECQVSYHAKQLTRGGEFLTHLWLLLTISGFTDKVKGAGYIFRQLQEL